MKIEAHDLVVLTKEEDKLIGDTYDLARSVVDKSDDPAVVVAWDSLMDSIADLPYKIDRGDESSEAVEEHTTPNGGKWSKELTEAICALPKELFEELLHSIEDGNMKAYSNGFRDGCKEK